MDTKKLYKELSESNNQEEVIEQSISDELIRKNVGKSCEKTGIIDCEQDQDKNFTLTIYVELAGHGDVEYNDNGDNQDSDGDNYDIAESRGRVIVYLSPESAEWEFEVE
jgi:hypothetical protein